VKYIKSPQILPQKVTNPKGEYSSTNKKNNNVEVLASYEKGDYG